MNLKERNEEVVRARDVQFLIAETRKESAAAPEGRAAVQATLVDAQTEFNDLIKIGKRDPRVMELNGTINDLQDELRGMVHAPNVAGKCYAAGSGVTLRVIGRETINGCEIGGSGGNQVWARAVNVEAPAQCERWLSMKFVSMRPCFWSRPKRRAISPNAKRSWLAARRNWPQGDNVTRRPMPTPLRLRAEVQAEKERRAEETRERLEQFDRERADYRAKLDRDMAKDKIDASLAFDRRAAKKEVRRHAWLVRYWQKIARARNDEEYRKEWLANVFAKSTERGKGLERIFRSVGDSASALRASEQFDLIRQRWESIVVLLDADPTLTTDEAEAIADPEYQVQREELKEIDEERLAAHNEAQAMIVGKSVR